jgi:hypothetical protein
MEVDDGQWPTSLWRIGEQLVVGGEPRSRWEPAGAEGEAARSTGAVSEALGDSDRGQSEQPTEGTACNPALRVCNPWDRS